MDLPLLLSFQTILSDLELLKMITSRYLHSPSFITLTDGTKIPCRIDKKSFFQCLGILLENGESAWLRENEPSLSAKLDEEEVRSHEERRDELGMRQLCEYEERRDEH